MARVRIKFCGMMRPEDARAAAEAGADAIGLVFHPPARRCISVEQAEAILAALPAFVTPVGLFVDAAPQAMRETAARLHLHTVQLHGQEPPETVAALQGLSVIKVLHVQARTLGQELSRWREAIQRLRLSNLKGLLLETAVPGQAGGTGVENDWDTIHQHQQAGAFAGLPPLIAAGGLTPESVADVVRLLRPAAVDVSSGVEASPGQKSVEKMNAFARAVGEAARSG